MKTFLYLLATFASVMFERQPEKKQQQIVTPESLELFNAVQNVKKRKEKNLKDTEFRSKLIRQ